jgi:hypothetical protein
MAKNKRTNLLRQIWDFLKVRKAWWLLPLIVMTLLLGVLLIIASSSKASIFIYTLF